MMTSYYDFLSYYDTNTDHANVQFNIGDLQDLCI